MNNLLQYKVSLPIFCLGKAISGQVLLVAVNWRLISNHPEHSRPRNLPAALTGEEESHLNLYGALSPAPSPRPVLSKKVKMKMVRMILIRKLMLCSVTPRNKDPHEDPPWEALRRVHSPRNLECPLRYWRTTRNSRRNFSHNKFNPLLVVWDAAQEGALPTPGRQFVWELKLVSSLRRGNER